MPKFQPPRAKTVAVRVWLKFLWSDRATYRAAARSKKRCTFCCKSCYFCCFGWCLANSLLDVFLLCVFSGKYGTHVGPLFLLHMLYILLSVWACFRIFSQPSSRDVQLTVSEDQNWWCLWWSLFLKCDIYVLLYISKCKVFDADADAACNLQTSNYIFQSLEYRYFCF